MSEHQIVLSDKIYAHLFAVSQAQGLSPTEWIASKLPDNKPIQPAANLLKDISDLIGSIDSQEEPPQTYHKTAFSEALVSKLAKQGIHLP